MTAGALATLTFNHLGLAVRREEDAIVLLRAMGYEIGDSVFDPLQNVHARLCRSAAHPAVEILQPGEGKSPVDSFLNKYNEIIYHVCYETDDLSRTLADLESRGLRCQCLAERKPAVLFGGRHVSFYRVAGFGIIELLERN